MGWSEQGESTVQARRALARKVLGTFRMAMKFPSRGLPPQLLSFKSADNGRIVDIAISPPVSLASKMSMVLAPLDVLDVWELLANLERDGQVAVLGELEVENRLLG